jgi:hypothetical protein
MACMAVCLSPNGRWSTLHFGSVRNIYIERRSKIRYKAYVAKEILNPTVIERC